ncbi:MAG: cupin domain-containing protein [bacterium]|jgi:quercetin dioxygenase-like cupin family protein|nr:cupin domain-containing protein [Planctomycetota bacterium]HIL51413.1 cupin domain-containing protein [Planctomycetota bacterium]
MSFTHTDQHREFSSEKLRKSALFETPQMFCDTYCLEPGQEQRIHAHEGATKFYLVLEGQAAITIGEERRTLRSGGLAWAESGEVHGVSNISREPCVLLVAMAPHPGL